MLRRALTSPQDHWMERKCPGRESQNPMNFEPMRENFLSFFFFLKFF
jgi:hypothetical protein